MLSAIFAQAADPASAEQLTRDSAILGEQFYFFTVVVMWLIHAGFMSYEAGVARRKNVMATAMKNILTIAVVTPTFYYFGWWIYNCNQPGLPIGPNSSDFTAAACQGGIPWSDTFGPNLTNNINLVFFLAFLLFSWTTASILSGAIIERARISAYLVFAVLLGSVVWILDAAWGWSAGGWLTMRFGFHDSIASCVVHGVAGGYFASRGDPFWTISGGLAGVIGVSAGADVYAPTLAYLISMLTAVLAVFAGNWLELKMR